MFQLGEFERWRPLFPDMSEVVSPGRKGEVEIVHCSVKGEWKQWKQEDYVLRGFAYEPGRWVNLIIGGEGWMHDIPGERWLNRHVVERAKGDVLVIGLGIGMILHPILRKREVRSVHVLEINPDVASLVEPTLRHATGYEKLQLEFGNGETWVPRRKYDTIWIDCIAGASVSEWYVSWCEWWMSRYRPYLNLGGWIGHWMYPEAVEGLGNGKSVPQNSVAL